MRGSFVGQPLAICCSGEALGERDLGVGLLGGVRSTRITLPMWSSRAQR